jgi:hypothetical protein
VKPGIFGDCGPGNRERAAAAAARFEISVVSERNQSIATFASITIGI